MVSPDQALASLPDGLRKPLLQEFSSIINNYLENRWAPSELSGGRFCEIVYTILEGYAIRNYASSPSKPRNFVDACRRLENHTGIPRSFQILIPRLLPALYEIRNNRGVGHVGGDVDPNFMDSTAVVSMASWVMAELVRVLHGVPISEAQQLVDNLVERRLPLVWKSRDVRRVLNPQLSLKDQILLLVASTSTKVPVDHLFQWLDYGDRGYFNRLLRKLHDNRMIEFDRESQEVELLPPGSDYVSDLLATKG
jgi:hypothetical protein